MSPLDGVTRGGPPSSAPSLPPSDDATAAFASLYRKVTSLSLFGHVTLYGREHRRKPTL